MSGIELSTNDPSLRQNATILDSTMAYIDIGSGDPIVFLHGNPTYSYLWRNVIPFVTNTGRCLAPDLMGMGYSGKMPNEFYRFVDHRRYLDAWFEALGLTQDITLVVHDWGSALGFDWANRHRTAVKGIVYMEAIVQSMTWQQWPEIARGLFQALRSSAGEEMILKQNMFVEVLLPGSANHDFTDNEMAAYRAPYADECKSRLPTLTWPRELPVEGHPEDVVEIVEGYGKWLEKSSVRKLFVNGDPGMTLTGEQREYCRSWPNQEEITVPGVHFLQEDSAEMIGRAVADFVSDGEMQTA